MAERKKEAHPVEAMLVPVTGFQPAKSDADPVPDEVGQSIGSARGIVLPARCFRLSQRTHAGEKGSRSKAGSAGEQEDISKTRRFYQYQDGVRPSGPIGGSFNFLNPPSQC